MGNTLLMKGKVVRFAGNGRKLGYPTANLDVETALRDGVYFGHAALGEFTNQPSLIFVGTPTTVGDIVRRVEVHMLDIADKDYYGQEINVTVEHFHRPNQKFASIEDLIEAMKEDENTARSWFAAH